MQKFFELLHLKCEGYKKVKLLGYRREDNRGTNNGKKAVQRGDNGCTNNKKHKVVVRTVYDKGSAPKKVVWSSLSILNQGCILEEINIMLTFQRKWQQCQREGGRNVVFEIYCRQQEFKSSSFVPVL